MGRAPPRYYPVVIGGIPCYSNMKLLARSHTYSDNCHHNLEVAGATYEVARLVVTKCPLCIVPCMIWPQQSPRAEMHEAVMGTAIANDGDEEYIYNKGVTRRTYCTYCECTAMDI